MKTKKFFDINQATNYLRHTLIRVAGHPVYVTDVQNGRGRGVSIDIGYVKADHPEGKTVYIDSMDNAVDMTPVPLGMVRHYNGTYWSAVHISRYPSRKWKIGLSRENISIQNPFGQFQDIRDPAKTFLPSKELAETILNKYMEMDEVMDNLKRHKGSLPLSRNFCLTHTGKLFYKMFNVPVGMFGKESRKLTLLDDYEFLSEKMKEELKC